MQVKFSDELNPKSVLAVGAHPDDIEFSAGGSMVKWAKDGAETHYLVLTDSSKGTSDRSVMPEDLTKRRQAEQRDAGKILGATSVEFLNYEDGALVCSQDLKRDIVAAIRRIKPDVVVTLDPSVFYSSGYGFMNHPDHRAAGEATLDAVYPLARNHMSFPELVDQGLETHIVSTVLLVNFDHHNFCIDITDTLEAKLQALAAHKSQYPDPTYIQDSAKQFASSVGESAGCTCAEAFMRIDLS